MTSPTAEEHLTAWLRLGTPGSVLHLGSLPQWVASQSPSDLSIACPVQASSAQLERRFNLVTVTTADATDEGHRRALLHTAVQHLDRDGHLIVLHRSDGAALCEDFGADDLLEVNDAQDGHLCVSLFRRGARFTVHDLLYEARELIQRVAPAELNQQMSSTNPPIVIDTRTQTDRSRFGVIANSHHVPRTTVEWHLDPANGYLLAAVTSFDMPIVVVCNGGYSSSLSAANLTRLGYSNVSDLIGGFQAWRTSGLPVQAPDHSHLDIPCSH